jgi:hypothetical protein
VPDAAKLDEVGHYFAMAAFIDVPPERLGKGFLAPDQNANPLHKSPVSFSEMTVFIVSGIGSACQLEFSLTTVGDCRTLIENQGDYDLTGRLVNSATAFSGSVRFAGICGPPGAHQSDVLASFASPACVLQFAAPGWPLSPFTHVNHSISQEE